MKENKKLKNRIRKMVMVFIILLVLSGITAFPLQTELNFLVKYLNATQNSGLLYQWLHEVSTAINNINQSYPFLAYGTDWLAFAHIIISIFFIGVYKDPVKNSWITTTGIIACLLVFPLAFIAGHFRGIPLFWILIDCSFGAFGLIPLLLIYKYTKKIEKTSTITHPKILRAL
jgi:hypothetical protein